MGADQAPARPKLVLLSLILAAAVANLNLSVANVALPDIGDWFDASQTQLNLVAVGYSLGLASSVVYLGALGDRYGRKGMLLLGVGLAIPVSILTALAPTVGLLAVARVFGGFTAGMAFPTTLALITALWAGQARTRSIALWSATGGAIAALGPISAGAVLTGYRWPAVFLLTLPLAVIAFGLNWKFVPGGVAESKGSVDNLSGVISIIAVGCVVLGINFAAEPDEGSLAIALGVVGLSLVAYFFLRQRRLKNPLYDLTYAKRRIFWVAAVAGIIVFGTLMGTMFIGQQYMQNVLDYSTVVSGLMILPAALLMLVVAPQSAKLIKARGSRFTLLAGYLACLLGFVTMLVFWDEDASLVAVGAAYGLIGIGVGLAGTPASHSLTGSVPVKRVGMASATADLQRDLGGAIMQSILGVFLTAGYAASFSKLIASSPNSDKVSTDVQSELTKSFSSAAQTAEEYPTYTDQIIEAAKQSFLKGDDLAFLAGAVAIILGAIVIYLFFPNRREEDELIAAYSKQDSTAG
ncbi:MAG: MFS transporter [Solirubrobacterales bacterium]|nr:MFS transporter [Solirubrobacterales bacterium]